MEPVLLGLAKPRKQWCLVVSFASSVAQPAVMLADLNGADLR